MVDKPIRKTRNPAITLTLNSTRILKSVRVHFAPGSNGRSFPLEHSNAGKKLAMEGACAARAVPARFTSFNQRMDLLSSRFVVGSMSIHMIYTHDLV